MKFEMTFKTVDDSNPVVKSYDIHPLYDELRTVFDTFLGDTENEIIERYTEEYTDFDYLTNTIPMLKYILVYSVSNDKIAHLEATIKLLETLDIDCDFKIID